MRRAVVVVVLATALSAALLAPAATAQSSPSLPRCGERPATAAGGARRGGARRGAARSAEPARATLTLDARSDLVVSDVSFGRDTDRRLMTLVFVARGCRMTSDAAAPADPPRILPARSGRTVPRGAVRLDGDPDVEGDRYVVHLSIRGDLVDPGTSNGFVEIRADWLETVRTPIAVSRSENQRLWPIGLGLAGASAGFFLFWFLRRLKRNDLLVTRGQLVLAGVVSIVAGTVTAYATNYLNQDVWTVSANGWAATVIAFTASTSGVMTALLAAVWGEDARGDRGERGRAPAPR